MADCADAARNLLREREERYPALVEDGKLSATAADRGLSLARALVAQWSWIVDPAAPPLPESDGRDFGELNVDLAADVASAAARAARRSRREPDNEQEARIAQLYAALAWWQEDVDSCRSVARIVMAIDVERSRSATPRAAVA